MTEYKDFVPEKDQQFIATQRKKFAGQFLPAGFNPMKCDFVHNTYVCATDNNGSEREFHHARWCFELFKRKRKKC